MNSSKQEKLISLEAARGIASIVVFIHHFILAFLPHYHGILNGTNTEQALVGSVFFIFINGSAAVILFFVLSGFVLSYNFFSRNTIENLDKKLISRLPRLALPVTCSLFLSYILFNFQWMFFYEAGNLSNSDWLQKFAYGGLPQNYNPSIWEVIKKGTLDVFILGDSRLNNNLWTMKFEFFGSVLVYVAVLMMVDKTRTYQVIILSFLFILTLIINIYYLSFLAGLFLSLLRPQIKSDIIKIIVFLIGIYLFGYYFDQESYQIFEFIDIASNQKRILILTIASMLLIVSVMQLEIKNQRLKKLFLFLGKISFPLYLLHTLVLCSFSSIVYLYFVDLINVNIAIFITFILTCFILWPLVYLFKTIDFYAIKLAAFIEFSLIEKTVNIK